MYILYYDRYIKSKIHHIWFVSSFSVILAGRNKLQSMDRFAVITTYHEITAGVSI